MLEPDLTIKNGSGTLLRGTIKLCSDDKYHIILQGHLISAQPAFSCLVTPLVDDDVLLFKDDNNYFILSIIHRHKTNDLSIKLGDNLSLANENNNLKINAPNISLIAEDTLMLNASSQYINCEKAKFSIKKALFSGDELNFTYQSVKMICNCFQTISDTINTQAIRVYHWIDELEHRLVGQLRTIVKRTYRIDCDEMEILSEGDTKIVAKQIQLG